MPIRLNLHHEIDKQLAMKRRDPLKIALAGGIAIAAGCAIFYVIELAKSSSMDGELAALEHEVKTTQVKADAAKKREDELTTEMKASEAMVKHVEARFYWAPVLSSLASVVPRNVQITSIDGGVAGDAPKHCTVSIEGIAAGEEPRHDAEEFRKAIEECFASKYRKVSAKFEKLDKSPEMAQLDGHQLHAANFTIALSMDFGEEAPPPPPPVHRRHVAT